MKTRQTDDSNANGTRRDIKVKRQMLGTLTSFFSIGLHKVKPVWRNNNTSLGSKVKLMRSIAISVFLSIFLYACELWTFATEVEKRMQAFKVRCCRRLLNIFYNNHVTYRKVRTEIQEAFGKYDELLIE